MCQKDRSRCVATRSGVGRVCVLGCCSCSLRMSSFTAEGAFGWNWPCSSASTDCGYCNRTQSYATHCGWTYCGFVHGNILVKIFQVMKALSTILLQSPHYMCWDKVWSNPRCRGEVLWKRSQIVELRCQRVANVAWFICKRYLICLCKKILSQQRIRHFKIFQSIYFAYDVGTK